MIKAYTQAESECLASELLPIIPFKRVWVWVSRKTCIKFYWNGLEKSDWIDPYNFSNQSFNSD